MSLGLKRETVKLESHDKQWDEIAGQTIKTLKSILGDDAVSYTHLDVYKRQAFLEGRLCMKNIISWI